MITNYYRPQELEEALQLLSRPDTRPLGGGTVLSRIKNETFSVVDLQALGLDKIHKTGDKLEIGSTASLSLLLESPHIPPALAAALRLEAPLNLRNAGSAAGTLVACDGRSPFAAAMLALDAKCTVISKQSTVISLGELLPLRAETLRGKLITKIEIPLNVQLAFKSVARTPKDKPILCAALARWPSGRARLALGGWGGAPTLAMDGNEPGGIEAAARNASHDAADEWASAEYRREVAVTLAKRCWEQIA